MILGIGTDILLVSRFRDARDRHGSRFLNRLFTEEEQGYCLSRAEPDLHLAARFAAKEAALKALGTGWSSGIAWSEVEVCSSPGSAPKLVFHGKALQRSNELGCVRSHLSLTHDEQYGAAIVVLESAPE